MVIRISSDSSSWWRNVYVRGSLALLVTLLVFPVILGCDLCDTLDEYDAYLRTECGTSNLPDWLYWTGFAFWFFGDSNDSVAPSGRVEIAGSVEGSGKTAITLEWTPPPAASGFEFLSLQPDNPAGQPPFRFSSLETGVEVELAYRAPDLPAGRSEMILVDTFEVIGASGGRRASGLQTLVTANPEKVAAAAAAWSDRCDPGPPAMVKTAQHETPMLLWDQLIYPHPAEVPMTTGYCQAWADVLQHDGIFLAIQFPLTDRLVSERGSYSLPVVFNDGASPHLELLDERQSPVSIVDGRLEVRGEHHTFLENEMPARDGHAWLALAASPSSTVVCPEDLNLEGNEWTVHTELLLDLGSDELESEVTLEAWACFDHAGASVAAMLTRRPDTASFPSWNINCVGPIPLRVTPFETQAVPPFHLSGPASRAVNPPEHVVLHHYVRSLTPDPVMVQLDVSSSLGLAWALYGGTWDEPDLGMPLTGPVRLYQDTSFFNVWLLADVPEGTVGLEKLRLTATWAESPENSTWTTSLLSMGSHPQTTRERVRRPRGRVSQRP